jgi:hypothetical protein
MLAVVVAVMVGVGFVCKDIVDVPEHVPSEAVTV